MVHLIAAAGFGAEEGRCALDLVRDRVRTGDEPEVQDLHVVDLLAQPSEKDVRGLDVAVHQAVLMDFPVSMGGYEYTRTPDDPCVLQMISCPYGSVGAPRRDQYRVARYRMLDATFEDYEREIRTHLSGMLPRDLFDFDRDVASITVNRWPHGYTVGGPGDSTRVGRRPFGRITIATCDSAPGADMKTAIDMASRAVDELG